VTAIEMHPIEDGNRELLPNYHGILRAKPQRHGMIAATMTWACS